ncbi:DUF2250 domain-containing protein [Natrinema sp. SYSU A 869]|uniref:DUF2250 domain-containing protein n=1 Tax=Natrinema sp. SYSU A 869 TaxID=2871694 RepID=UPI001CA40C6E|nr:DUF2250 domain-containing protein [Natrinema sp. SYSU A 869]
MIASRADVERLRTEAEMIFTRIDTVTAALERARDRPGEHWDDRELTLELETPTGDSTEVALDLDQSAAENAQQRYERAGELAAKLDEREAVAGELAAVPPEPLAVLILDHLETVGTDDSRSMAGALDADHETVVDLSAAVERSGLLTELPVGDDRTRSAYRLTDDGDGILSFLEERKGKRRFLRWIEGTERLARRLSRGGPDYPRMTANELGLELTAVRHRYQAMEAVGLVTTYEGSIIKGTERKLKPKDETHRKHTYYVTTDVADRILRTINDE